MGLSQISCTSRNYARSRTLGSSPVAARAPVLRQPLHSYHKDRWSRGQPQSPTLEPDVEHGLEETKEEDNLADEKAGLHVDEPIEPVAPPL